jgi:hypothetical protein
MDYIIGRIKANKKETVGNNFIPPNPSGKTTALGYNSSL